MPKPKYQIKPEYLNAGRIAIRNAVLGKYFKVSPQQLIEMANSGRLSEAHLNSMFTKVEVEATESKATKKTKDKESPSE